MTMPTIDKSFCEAVMKAEVRINKAREERDTCPSALGGCGRKGALCRVTKRGMQLGSFCPICQWSSLFLDQAKGRVRVAPKKGAGAGKRRA